MAPGTCRRYRGLSLRSQAGLESESKTGRVSRIENQLFSARQEPWRDSIHSAVANKSPSLPEPRSFLTRASVGSAGARIAREKSRAFGASSDMGGLMKYEMSRRQYSLADVKPNGKFISLLREMKILDGLAGELCIEPRLRGPVQDGLRRTLITPFAGCPPLSCERLQHAVV